MKTAIKSAALAAATALAVVTVFVALSCAPPDVALTDKDYKDYNEAKSATYTNSPAPNASISGSYSLTSGATADSLKSIQVSLNANADIFKEKGDFAAITKKLQEFLNFYQYTNPTTPDANKYEKSTLGTTPLGYTLSARGSNTLTVILDSVPNDTKIVGKIKAASYKVYGQPLDKNGDGTVDEYDDVYQTFPVTPGASSQTNIGADFVVPYFTYDVTPSIGGGLQYGATAVATRVVPIVGLGGVVDISKSYRLQPLKDLAAKIEFQKYNPTSKTWEKGGDVNVWDGTGTAPGIAGYQLGQSGIYASFAPADLVLYRVKVSGIKGFKTSTTFGDAPAIISINGSTLKDTYISSVSVCTIGRNWQTTLPSTTVFVKSDGDKKNVVLEWQIGSLSDTNGTQYPDTLTTEKFKESVKLVYDSGKLNPANDYQKESVFIDVGTDLGDYLDLVLLPIEKVVYSASKRNSGTNDKIDTITITLDPKYQIDGTRKVALLLNPGFKYTGGIITFGDLNSDVIFADGTTNWRSYGQFGTNNL